MAIIKFLLIAFLVYYLLRLVAKAAFPFLFRDFSQQQRQNTGRERSNGKAYKEGEVSIEYQPKTKKKVKDQAGEYVDYEEIKE